MIYRAKIQNGNEIKILKLGRCSGVGGACALAKSLAPKGWQVIDVWAIK